MNSNNRYEPLMPGESGYAPCAGLPLPGMVPAIVYGMPPVDVTAIRTPSMHPTAMLPPAPPNDPTQELAQRFMLLAHDISKGRVSDTDQVFLAGVLRTLAAF